MKKAIVGISVLMIAIFAVIITVNGQDKPQEQKKSSTEMTSKDCHSGSAGGSCCKMKYGSTADNNGSGHGKCCSKDGTHNCCKDGKAGSEGSKSAGTESADKIKSGQQPAKK